MKCEVLLPWKMKCGIKLPTLILPNSVYVSLRTLMVQLARMLKYLVTTADSNVAISNLLLGRVQVGIAVVEVAKFITSVELKKSKIFVLK